MRALILVLVATGLGAGCRGTDGRKRDFLSTNRWSLSFLKETMREGRKLRRENLKQDLDFKDRFAFGRRHRKESLRFLRESFLGDERRNARTALANLKEELRWKSKEIRYSALFGHLDSGDP